MCTFSLVEHDDALAKIEAFWQWFEHHEPLFSAVEDPEKVVELLNDQVLSFGLFAWELSQGIDAPHAFTISPNGDRERLALSTAIVAAAPTLPGWEFYAAKPAVTDPYQWEVYNSFMQLQTIDASDWIYVAMKGLEGFRLIICTGMLHGFEVEDLAAIGTQLINRILGEATCIMHFSAIEVVMSFEMEHESISSPITDLVNHFS